MPKLRDYFTAELNNFFNLDEFGEKHLMNGHEVTCIVDKQEYGTRTKSSAAIYAITEGVYLDTLTVYCRTDEYPGYHLPEFGEAFQFDHQDFIVNGISNDGGVLQISLMANRA